MVTIVLECVKKNEWEIKTEGGSVVCRGVHHSKEDAVEWCHNYMTSFQMHYEIKVVEYKR